MDHPSFLAVEILKGARRWVQSRVVVRRVLDSKSATPAQVKKAQMDNQQAANELEGLVMRLERYLHNTGTKFPIKRGVQNPFPWRELLGAVAAGARAVETAIEGVKVPPGVVEAKVVDAKVEK